MHLFFQYLSIQKISNMLSDDPDMLLGSSTETVAFQVYEILKIDHEFLQFF